MILDTKERSSNAASQTDTEFMIQNPSIFQWTYFHDDDKFEVKAGEAQWTQRLKERGQFFYTFLKMWTEHIKRTSQGAVIWSAIPGYPLFISAFYKQMTSMMHHTRKINQTKLERKGIPTQSDSNDNKRDKLWPNSLRHSLMECRYMTSSTS